MPLITKLRSVIVSSWLINLANFLYEVLKLVFKTGRKFAKLVEKIKSRLKFVQTEHPLFLQMLHVEFKKY